MTSHKAVQFVASFGTNVGLRRTLNEDRLLAQFPVFVVADGMGGHQAGEVASQMAIDCFAPLAGRADVLPQEVSEAAQTAQTRVSELADALEGGAGTTLTGVVAVRSAPQEFVWMVLNIGDSRTYRRVGDMFVRLTVDHSHVQELIQAGQITETEAITHPSRNVITRALGDETSELDYWMTPIVPGERLVIVSDGAFEGMGDQDLAQVASAPEARDAVEGILDSALAMGGSDNISAVVVDVVDAGGGTAMRFAPDQYLPPVEPVPASALARGVGGSGSGAADLPEEDTGPSKHRQRA